MSKVNDFTVGNVRKLILAFYFPIFATSLLQQFYNFVDTAIVGNGLGDNALAAVGNMGSLCFLIFGFAGGIGNGFSILIAQAFGARQYENMRKYIASAICLTAGITVFLTSISLIFMRRVLVMMQTDPLIIEDSLRYGYILFGGMLFTLIYNVSGSVLRALGDSKVPMQAMIVASVLNIALDSFFIFGLKLGVESAAIATVISQALSGMVCLSKLRKIEIVRLSHDDFKGNGERYISLLKNGIPMGIMNSITAIGCMVVQFFVNGLGVVYTSAYAVCSRYLNLFMLPASTAGQAASAYTSQNYGAGKWDRIIAGLKVSLTISFITYITLGSVMVLFPRPLARVFLSGEQAIDMVAAFLPTCGIAILTVDCLFVIRSTVQGMGFPMIPMISGVAEMFLRAGTIRVFVGIVDFRATAFAEIAAWSGALLLNLIALVRIMRRKDALQAEHHTLRSVKA